MVVEIKIDVEEVEQVAGRVLNGQMHLLNFLFSVFIMLFDITGTKTMHVA